MAIIDTRPVNRPIFYGNSEVNQCARLAKISWFNVSLVVALHFMPWFVNFNWLSRFGEKILFMAIIDTRR